MQIFKQSIEIIEFRRHGLGHALQTVPLGNRSI